MVKISGKTLQAALVVVFMTGTAWAANISNQTEAMNSTALNGSSDENLTIENSILL